MKTKMMIVLAILFSLQSFGQTVGQIFASGGINYRITSATEVEVASNPTFSTIGSVVLPSNVSSNANSYQVISIGNQAFDNCSLLTAITVPNSVTSIGNFAFRNCVSLSAVNLPNSVLSLGEASFMNCRSITAIAIPSSVNSIGLDAFWDCSSLINVVIPSAVSAISPHTFYQCTALTSVKIPNSVTSIGTSAFLGCTSLPSITIPHSVTSIGNSSFANCTQLAFVTFSNALTVIGPAAFQGCTSLLSISIPNSVTEIGDYAFRHCSNLVTVAIPNSVTNIKSEAFRNCTALHTVIVNWTTPLPINRNVFDGLDLSNITLNVPTGTETIYDATAVWTEFAPITAANRPAPPIATAQNFVRRSTTVANLVASGQDLRWYNVAIDGGALPTNARINTGTYYVSQTVDSRESRRTTVAVTVNIGSVIITSVPQTKAITFGEKLSTSTLTNGVASVEGSFVFSSPATVPNAGITNYEVSFIPTDTDLYETTTTTVSVTVNKATPIVVTTPSATGIAAGQTLATSKLTGGLVLSKGTEVEGDIILKSGGQAKLTVVKVVKDLLGNSLKDATDLVDAAPVKIATISKEFTIDEAEKFKLLLQEAGAEVEINSNIVEGYFAYANPKLAPSIGTAPQNIIFTPTDNKNYNTVDATIATEVYEKTLPPTAGNQTFYGTATIADLVAVGLNLNWYDVPVDGKPLESNTAIKSGIYYVSQTIGGRESLRTSIAVVVDGSITPVTESKIPTISYPSGLKYFNIGEKIAPLTPSNSGGAVKYEVATFAGSGEKALVEDGIGTAASFNNPTGITTDLAGNVYVADFNKHTIRKITSAGVVTTIAGSGIAGAANGTGTAASFRFPYGVAVDTKGNLYVTDSENHRIRKITPAGVVSNFVGSGKQGKTDGRGTAASFNNPTGIAIDAAGNCYVADSNNNTIRKITITGVVTTIAGSGTAADADGLGAAASFNYPVGVAVDKDGNVIVADSKNNKIRAISPEGLVTTVTSTKRKPSLIGLEQEGTYHSLNAPTGVAVNNAGEIYIVEKNDYQLLQYAEVKMLGDIVLYKSTTGGQQSNGPRVKLETTTLGEISALYPRSVCNNCSGPGVAVTAAGFVYVAVPTTNVVSKIHVGEYTINTALPDGLSFDGTTGAISGTPTVATNPTAYTITARNGAGSNSTSVTIATPPLYTSIPDNNFEQALFDKGIDTVLGDNRVLTSAIVNIPTLDVSNKAIADLTGIEAFYALIELKCGGNTLRNLNISSLIWLENLNCNNNLITTLELNSLISLKELNCDINQLTQLKINAISNLERISCTSNRLTNLEVTSHLRLQRLYCAFNQLNNLNLTGLFFLEELGCTNNHLSTLNLSDARLQIFLCGNNPLNSLNLSNQGASMRFFHCDNSNLNQMDLRGFGVLTDFNCTNNPFINCISVDDVVYATANYSKDATASFNNDCFAPIAINYCQNTVATRLASPFAVGIPTRWYTTAVGGTASVTAPTPATNIVGTRIFYVSQVWAGIESRRIAITINTLGIPAAVGAITGVAAQGALVGTTTSATYTVAPVANATVYNWTVPAGVTIISGQGTNTLTVNFSNVPAGAGPIGFLMVVAENAEGCSTRLARTLALTKALPAASTAIRMTDAALAIPTSGIPTAVTNISKYIGTNTVLTLTATPVAGVTTYEWELPTGINVLSGAAITRGGALGSNVITVNFAGVVANTLFNYTTTAGILTHVLRVGVRTITGVGASVTNNATLINPTTTNTARLLTLIATAPRASSAIRMTDAAGDPSRAITNISTLIGTNRVLTLTATLSALANSYSWELPTGVTQLSGTNTNIITVNFAGVPAGTTILYPGVKAVNGVGESFTSNTSVVPATTSTARLLKLTASLPGTVPGVSGQTTGVCGIRPISYTIAGSPTATSYEITAPKGAKVTSKEKPSNGSNVLTTADLEFTVIYPEKFTTTKESPASISVLAVNGVGKSVLARKLVLTTTVPPPTDITITRFPKNKAARLKGQLHIFTNRLRTKKAVSLYEAFWTVNDGVIIVSGQGTDEIEIDYSKVLPTIKSTKVSLYIKNSCGVVSLPITITIILEPTAAKIAETIAIEATEVYPNPVVDDFTIDVTASKVGTLDIAIYSLEGIQVADSKTFALKEGSNTITQNVSNLAKGIYIVQLLNSSNNEVITKKLIKN